MFFLLCWRKLDTIALHVSMPPLVSGSNSGYHSLGNKVDPDNDPPEHYLMSITSSSLDTIAESTSRRQVSINERLGTIPWWGIVIS